MKYNFKVLRIAKRASSSHKRKGGLLHPKWHHTPEARAKIGEANKRRKISEETRQKMSNSHKGTYPTLEARKKMSLNHNTYFSPETRQKISESKIGGKNPMYGIGSFAGKHHSVKTRKMLSRMFKGKNSQKKLVK